MKKSCLLTYKQENKHTPFHRHLHTENEVTNTPRRSIFFSFRNLGDQNGGR